MKDEDKKPFSEVIQALAATFRVEPTRALLHGYWLGLQDLSLEEVRGGALKALQTAEFMPAPAKLGELGKKPHPNAQAGGVFLKGAGWIFPFEDSAEEKHKRLRARPREESQPTDMAGMRDMVTGLAATDPRDTWPAREPRPAGQQEPDRRLPREPGDE